MFAATFWTNSSSSHEVYVLGGNFSFVANGSSSRSSGVALYDPTSSSLSGLQGDQISGSVHTVFVSSNTLFVGGNFTVGSSSGLAVYDLSGQKWQTGGQSLTGIVYLVFILMTFI